VDRGRKKTPPFLAGFSAVDRSPHLGHFGSGHPEPKPPGVGAAVKSPASLRWKCQQAINHSRPDLTEDYFFFAAFFFFFAVFFFAALFLAMLNTPLI
jgi:hypothetical protein